MDWLKKLKDYAPDIAAAVLSGGATLPQLAIKVIADATGDSSIQDANSLASFVQGASPEMMLAVKKANNEFLVEMKTLELDWQKIKLADQQQRHAITQQTIINGDNSEDKEIRMVRPTMAKQSWTATIGYCIGCLGIKALAGDDLFDVYIAGFLSAPAFAYLGLRTGDKFAQALKIRKSQQ